MAQDRPPKPPPKGAQGQQNDRKRKDAPPLHRNDNAKRPKQDHRSKLREARELSTQATGKAFRNGELDVDKFVKAREFEIRALEEGMSRSKKALTKRAFQQVPKELRRRTASHNVKRVPKQLQKRARKEMIEDNTPTVNAKTRKPTRHMRLRLETAKRLRALGAKMKAEKEASKVTVIDPSSPPKPAVTPKNPKDKNVNGINIRVPKVKKAFLATPPVPKAKFRKRQIHKAWLPTHLFHAKRAHMTPPSEPLWRFSIAVSPTTKSYRPTHRASHDRGAVAWDMSYMSTIGLEGRQGCLMGVLKALGVPEEQLTVRKGEKWRQGVRVWEGLVFEREAPCETIAPATVVWCVYAGEQKEKDVEVGKRKRKLLIRVHPAAFFQLWEEVLRLSKVAKPQVSVEDLRFEIGSIEITGPGATEALLGALWPIDKLTKPTTSAPESADDAMEIDESLGSSVERTWTLLAGLTNPATLPQRTLLAFNVQDPRLHHPPRTIKLPKSEEAQNEILKLSASWPVDATQPPPSLFDRSARLAASRALPSQKAVNRRKALAPPGQYPVATEKDPKIPVLLYTTTTTDSPARAHNRSSTWTLLLPWKCVTPVWYSTIYYPLSTGTQPRFAGLEQKRQILFEAGVPWFPGDFPGTKAGWEWEAVERRKREGDWKKRPRGKRIAWEKIVLGEGRKGEIGSGWACDWERLLAGPPKESDVAMADADCGVMKTPEQAEPQAEGATEKAAPTTNKKTAKASKKSMDTTPAVAPLKPVHLTQLSAAQATKLLSSPTAQLNSHIRLDSALTTVRLTLLTRGVPQTCARIYCLPSEATNAALRKAWLALLPAPQPFRKQKGPKHSLPRLPKDAPSHVVQQRLAQSLIETPRAGEDDYPACPGEEDLIGFVTTGNFDLGEGQGTGIGSLLIGRVLEEVRVGGEKGRLCVVRNAGNGVGRLARWEVV